MSGQEGKKKKVKDKIETPGKPGEDFLFIDSDGVQNSV